MTTASVLLNIYSGRPNPRWSLSEAQVREFSRMLESLEKVENLEEGDMGLQLGYRGLTIVGELIPGISSPIEVFDGKVLFPEGVLLDRDRRVERWLLESAGPALSPELLEDVASEWSGGNSS